MNRPPFFVLGLFAWLGLELAVFVAIVQSAGLACALLLGLATSFAGMVLLRQVGTGALGRLRSSFQGALHRPDAMMDDLIRAVAAVLLILPGFLSDLVGFALAAPSVRKILLRRFGGESPVHYARSQKSRAQNDVVDLAPEEWVSVDGPARH